MAKFDAKNYIRNVVKSAGYISVTTLKGLNPAMTSFISDTAGSARDMYDNVKDFRHSVRYKVDDIMESEYGKFGKEAAGNFIDDLKTGKWYNKERQNSANERLMKDMGFDFNLDDEPNWNEMENDLGSSENSVTSSDVNNAATIVSSTTANSISKSTNSILAHSRGATKTIVKTNEYNTGVLNTSLAAIHSSILSMHQDIGKPLGQHIINSSKFYISTTEELAKQTTLLKGIYDILNDRYGEGAKKKNKFSRKTDPWEEVFGGELPNFRNLGSAMKNKYKDVFGMASVMGSLFDPEILKQFKASAEFNSPVAALMSFGLTSLFNNSFGASMGRMNRSISDSIIHRMARYSKSGGKGMLGSILAQLLDISPKANNKFDTSKYEKGRVDWNGMDDKALREVIPTQLAQILSALTGEEPKVFNYQTGRWTTISGAKRAFDKSRRATIESATSGYKDQLLEGFVNEFQVDKDSVAAQSFLQDYKNLMQIMATTNLDPTDINKLEKDLTRLGLLGNSTRNKKYAINKSNFQKLKQVFSRSRDGAVYTAGFTGASFRGRTASNRYMENGAYDTGYEMVRNGSGMLRNDYSRAGGWGNSGRSSGRSQYKKYSGSRISPYVKNDYYFEDNQTKKTTNRFEREKEEKKSEAQKEFERSAAGQAIKRFSDNKKDRDSRHTMFDTIGESIATVMVGNVDKDTIKQGVLGLLKAMPGLIGDEFKKAIDSIKNLWDKFKESALGQKLIGKWNDFKNTDFYRDFTGEFHNAGRWVKDSFKSTYSNVKSKFAGVLGERDDGSPFISKGKASRGGHVLKSGIVSVSEGEYIIPAERNPYYNGKINKWSQDRTETRNASGFLNEAAGNINRFWGKFRKGSNKHGTQNNKKKKNKYKSRIFRTAQKLGKVGGKAAKGASKIAKEEAEDIPDDVKTLVQEVYENSQFLQDAVSGLNYAKEKMTNAVNIAFGEGRVQDTKDIAKLTQRLVSQHLGKNMAGGTMGALIGAAATGSGLGLLGGFVIGTGIATIKNSQGIQKVLFGEKVGEDYTGGLLGPQLSNFLKKRFPSVAKSGVVGTILGSLGLVPGGLLGGFALGAGLNLIGDTERFKSVIFGHKGVDGKRRGGIVGMLKTDVVDPLAKYVDSGLKQLDDYIKKNIFNPVKKLFGSLADWSKGLLKRIGKSLSDNISQKVVKPFVNRLDVFFKPLTQVAGGVAKTGFKFARGVVRTPFRIAGAAGNALERHNINAGYSSLTPQERLAMEGKGLLGKVRNSEYTKFAAQATDEELEQLQFYNMGEKENRRAVKRLRQDLNDTLTATLTKGGMGDQHKITSQLKKLMNSKQFKAGDPSGVISWIDAQVKAGTMSPANGEKAKELVNKRVVEIAKKDAENENFKAERSNFFENIKAKGFDLSNMSSRDIIQNANDIANSKKRAAAEERKKKLEEAMQRQNDENLKDDAKKKGPVESKKLELLSGIKFILYRMAEADGVDVSDIKESANYTSGVDIPGKVKGAAEKLKEKADKLTGKDKQKEEKKDKVKNVVNPETGEVSQYVENADGNMAPNIRDAGTKNAIDNAKEDRSLRNRFYSAFLGESGFLSRLKDFFGIKKSDDGEKKETLWDKIKGFGSGITNFFKGGFGILKKIATGIMTLGPIVGLVGTIASFVSSIAKHWDEGIISVFKHGFDAADNLEASLLGFDRVHYDEDEWQEDYTAKRTFKSSLYQAVAGRNVKGYNTAGKVIRWGAKKGAQGAKAAGKVVAGASKGLSSAVKNKALNMAASGKFGAGATGRLYDIAERGVGGSVINSAKNTFKSGAGKAASAVSKTVSKATSKLTTKTATKAAESAASSGKIVNMIKKAINAAVDLVSKTIGKKGSQAAVQETIEQTAKQIGQNAIKQGGSTLAKGALKFLGKWAFVILAAENGFEDAQANIGLLEPPTIGERFLSAAAEAVSEVIFGLIPPDTLINFIIPIAQLLGFDLSDLQAKRQAAYDEWQEYEATEAKTTGKSYNTLKEYLKNVYNLKTTQDHIKDGAKAVWGGIKKAGGALWSGAKALGSGITKVGSGIANAGKAVFNAGKSVVGGAVENIKNRAGAVLDAGKNAGNIVSNGLKAGTTVAKTALKYATPIGMIKTGINFIKNPEETKEQLKEDFGSAINVLKETIGSPKEFNIKGIINKLIKSTDPNSKEDEKKPESAEKPENKKKSMIASLNDLVYDVLYAISSPVLGMVKGIRSIFGWLTGEKTGDSEADKAASDISKTTSTDSDTQSKGGFFSGIVNGFKSLFKSNDKKESATGTGSGIHVSQKGSFRRFGKYTVDKNGCGPAVAATVLRRYGKNASLDSTVSYAQANGYVAGSSGVGTRAGYFGDIFGANGIRSAYTSNKNNINNAIGAGSPTVLLGQDRSNSSKANSPFGPNPHYVVAQGKDKNGNIIVDDPELGNTAIYNKNILKHTKLGIMTGGDSGTDTNTAAAKAREEYLTKKYSGTSGENAIKHETNGKDIDISTPEGYVFNFFRNNGFSEAATAGIMGNIQNESGFKSDAIQGNGKGPAAGLFQWENYNSKTKRWKAMSDYAASKGKDWTDLQSQLEYGLSEMSGSENWAWKNYKSKSGISSLDEFKQMSDPAAAANAFMVSFERPSSDPKKNHIDRRKNDAINFYNYYTGSSIKAISSSDSVSSGSSANGSSTDNSMDLGGILGSILGKALGSVATKVGGVAGSIIGLITSGIGNNNSSSENNSEVDPNASWNTASLDKENAMVQSMLSIENKNEYSMDGSLRERVFDTVDKGAAKGYGDCSATVRKVIQRATGGKINIGGNTEDQYTNYASRGGIVVESTEGAGAKKMGKIDTSKLRPGDALYYSRPDSSYTKGRPDRVGHVEMYMGNGLRAGHGSGMGPKITDATTDQERFLKAIRFVNNDTSSNMLTVSSDKETGKNVTVDVSKMGNTGAGSGLPIIDFTKNSNNGLGSSGNRKFVKKSSVNNVSGGESGLTTTNSNRIEDLLTAMVKLLTQIAANSGYNAYLPTIFEALKTMGINITNMQSSNGEVDPNMSMMIAKLETISQTL